MNYLIISFITAILSTMSCRENNPDQNQWLGTFSVKQQCDGAATPDYQMKVSRVATDSALLTLDNVGGYGKKINATLNGDTLVLTPTDANVGLMGQVRLSGSGSFQDEALVIHLTVDVPGPGGTTTQNQCQSVGKRVVRE